MIGRTSLIATSLVLAAALATTPACAERLIA
jgi:hypothetical protein